MYLLKNFKNSRENTFHAMNKLLFVFLCILFFSCDNEENKDEFTIGIFGGSVSCRTEGDIIKRDWAQRLGAQIITKGVGGAGFSSLTENNIPSQIKNSESYDAYILWASTNDVVYATVGGLNDFDEKTQSGGIYKSINLIKEKNPEATIIFFGSLPAFNTYYKRIEHFVESQKLICDSLNIPYLEQFILCDFTFCNYSNYYFPDTYHLQSSGYLKMAEIQYDFLYEHLKDKIANHNIK